MALTEAQGNLLEAARECAKELDRAAGGPTGLRTLTGLIGELSACRDPHLAWEPSHGYDARTGDLRGEIKTRRCPTPGETMGWFGRKRKSDYPFEIAVYVELDSHFDVVGIWHMGVGGARELEASESSTWGLRIERFKSRAEKL